MKFKKRKVVSKPIKENEIKEDTTMNADDKFIDMLNKKLKVN